MKYKQTDNVYTRYSKSTSFIFHIALFTKQTEHNMSYREDSVCPQKQSEETDTSIISRINKIFNNKNKNKMTSSTYRK